MQQNGQGAQPPKKLLDFNEELKNLCVKYQYELQAVEQDILNPWGIRIGVRTTIQAFDVSPQDQQTPADPNPQAAAAPTPPAADQEVPTPPAAPLPPTTEPALPNTPQDVPTVPADPAADDAQKKSEEDAQQLPSTNPTSSDTVSTPSTESINQPADPANSIPGSDQPSS